ncbi:MAG TPA: amino acid adenylation domain-containing protein [Thermoanaerobaculia bacterium]|nr:amino acid adenylation domain-containing protein [Thermoanaerobaculia bacterium]
MSERSDGVARSLSGLSPEEPVAVRTGRGAGLAVALLGILKAGGVYLPLNPDHPEARLSRMLELSGARRVLSEAGLKDLKDSKDEKDLKDKHSRPSSFRSFKSFSSFKSFPAGDSLAYLLFTSGSTGDPKGVLVPHRGLLNHLLAKIQDLGLSSSDRVAQTAPQSFDIHIWQLLAPLLVGAAVEVLPDDIVRSPALLRSEVERRGITVLELVPSLIGPLLDEGGAPQSLRWLISTGEALSPELARRWQATGVPLVNLVNGYGPTECADRVSHAFLREIPEDAAVHTSIGRPIPNLRLHVLSPDLEPQPAGFPGEICIAGAGVGRGYLDDPARTAAAFVPDPFEPGGRLYRTGDLGRRRPDGELEVLGRIDHQVKLRGVRIEPGEIEAALLAHPGVREAVVAVRGGRLAAWWSGDPDAAPELRDHLRQRLPEVMVPAFFHRLEALPLNLHGKLDRRALPDPVEPAGAPSPGDEMEQLVAGIFGAVLGRERIGPRDDFFALGGHSLLAAQVTARVREALGIEPPLSLLFEESTVAGIAARLRTQAGLPTPAPVRRAARGGPIPLSFAQERLWFLHRLDPGCPAYNMPGLVRLSRPLESTALSGILARHEALRTTFPAVDGEPRQEIGPPVPVPVPVIDLSGLPDAEREAQSLAFQEGRRPFDLARGPLLRALLLELGHEQRLVVNLHHIVADGWSQEILARELLDPAPLPELPIQYADYAIWQREQPAARLDWWKSELSGDLAPLELPLDRLRPSRPRRHGARLPVLIPEETVRRLRQLARSSGATPFMVLLAAFQALLHRLSGQDDIRVGSPVANRGQAEIKGLVGCFVNPLVLRTRFGAPSGLRELVGTVRRTALGAYIHQDVPFELLVNELQPRRDPGLTPLFQALLVVQPGASILKGVEEIDNGTSKLDLALSLREAEDRMEGWIEHDTELFDGATVERWSAALLTLLETGISDPQRPLAELPLLNGPRREQVSAGRSPAPSGADGPPAGPVEGLIAEIWAQVLDVRAVSRNASFFDLGGHSLLGVRLISRLNEAFGTGLLLRDLFEAPTVAGLARLVSAGTRERPALPELYRVPRGEPFPLSFAQERLWVMEQLIAGQPVYNLFQALDLSGRLDEAALERAFDEVVRLHETLRTRFVTVHGRPMQVVEPHRHRPLPAVDVSWDEADRLTEEDARQAFDLRQGPLLRVTLLRLGETEHRLLVAMHHIVCDGWSLDVLVREVGALYRGQTLPELPFQYADFVDWQRRWPAEILDAQLAWWRDRLAGLAALDLPTDRPRPRVQSFQGGLEALALRPFGTRDRRATPFLLMLAAWQILLHRLTGQTDVAVGSPAANRGRPELEDLIGIFVNNLVLRVDLSGEPTFAGALDRAREATLSAHARQDLPFERLVAELVPERDLSRSPLAQVAFSLQEALPPPLGLRCELVDVHTGTSRFDLWLQVRQEGEGWSARAEYATDLFDGTTVRRWLGHLQALLEGIAASPEVSISELSLLSRAERHQLRVEWNDDISLVSTEATVHRLVEEQAARTPDAVALLFGDIRLTYGELDACADALAERLLALGARPEACVALLAERSPDLVVALLAILKSGAAYAPLDPELPAERLSFLLEDLRPPVVLAQEALLPRLPACEAAVVLLEEQTAGLPSADPRPSRLAGGLAYVLYTSGSTGSPKPVGVTHAALAEHVLAMADLLGLSERDRTLFFASPAFDVSLEQLLTALVRGATVVLRGPELWPPADFSRIAGRLGLTVAELPTAYWRQWVREPSSGVPALRLVTAGGEAMPAEEARLWLRSPLAGVRLLNAYGPTEAVITATALEVDGASASRPGAVALGRPLPGRRACVVDLHGQLQPVGVAGELCLGGRPLARGYLGRPDLTAERFVPDPSGEGERLYRTGDLARRLPDGTFQFLGRIDRQVKIRGIRIELEEIETVLRRCPGVSDAVVLAREDRPNDRRLVAYCVAEPEREPSSDQLRAWLRGKLPEAMVPAAFVSLEAMPLTESGKIDRRALPAPAAEPVQSGEAPRTPLESLVAGVFAEILGAAEVPRDVSFFDLGGNSLLATQVVTLLQEILPVELNLRKVFEGPTVARLAQLLEEEGGALAGPERLAMGEILAEYERLTDQSSRSVIMGSNLAARRAGR